MEVSVIICTYNPNPENFRRVLSSVAQLEVSGMEIELILVDNNSSLPVADVYQSEIQAIPFPVKKITEYNAGLLFARISGFENSSGKYLVFFDDDNIPDPGYLKAVPTCFTNFPNVAIWGPGKISVEFAGNPPAWIYFHKSIFQERNFEFPRYACVDDWLAFFPPGTGQCIRREIFADYILEVKEGRLSAVGRSGKSLSSAEDVQLVFEAIKKNYAVGVFPDLKLVHLIAPSKSNQKYLCRLLFGMASSYPEAYAESFPVKRKLIPYHSDYQIFQKVVGCFFSYLVLRKSPRLFLIKLADLLGQIYGANCARGLNQDSFWFHLINVLKLR